MSFACSVLILCVLVTNATTKKSTNGASHIVKDFDKTGQRLLFVGNNESNRTSWKLEHYVLQFLMSHQIEETLELNHSILVDITNDTWRSTDKRHRLDAATPRHYNVTWVYPSVCGHLPVQESTATLLVARAHAKAGNTKLAWSILESLFDGQEENGFIPKYLYSRQLNETEYYIANSSIPNWRLFHPFFNDSAKRRSVSRSSSFQPPGAPHYLGWRTSGRISAIPLHATIVRDIYLTSRQSIEDVMALERNVHRIFSQHSFIHGTVMRNCHAPTLNTSTNTKHDNAVILNSGCYNIVHPWESLASVTSSMWQSAMKTTIQSIKSHLWTRSWPLPAHMQQQHFDSEPNYNASIFLLECFANATRKNHSCSNSVCEEDWVLSSCPYLAVLDVGFAAALTKSDVDLYQSLQILLDRRPTKERDPTDRAKFWKGRMAQVRKWQEQNEYIWDNLLWNQEKETFSSRYLNFASDKKLNSSLLSNATSYAIVVPTSNDFLASWAATTPDKRLQSMAARLMQKHDEDSFDCGDVGLWPRGGCDESSQRNTTVEIDPIVNWLVGSGLQRYGEVALGKYLDQSTLQLVCGWKKAGKFTEFGSFALNETTCGDPLFQTAYSVGSDYEIRPVRTSCDITYMATAALVYSLLVPDTTQHEIPTPPIRNSWVITLIAVELVVAFSIGLSCLSLSWILTCRLKSYQSNELLPILDGNNTSRRLGYFPSNAESVGEPYFSAQGSYASSDEINDSLSLTSNEMPEGGTSQQSLRNAA